LREKLQSSTKNEKDHGSAPECHPTNSKFSEETTKKSMIIPMESGFLADFKIIGLSDIKSYEKNFLKKLEVKHKLIFIG